MKTFAVTSDSFELYKAFTEIAKNLGFKAAGFPIFCKEAMELYPMVYFYESQCDGLFYRLSKVTCTSPVPYSLNTNWDCAVKHLKEAVSKHNQDELAAKIKKDTERVLAELRAQIKMPIPIITGYRTGRPAYFSHGPELLVHSTFFDESHVSDSLAYYLQSMPRLTRSMTEDMSFRNLTVPKLGKLLKLMEKYSDSELTTIKDKAFEILEKRKSDKANAEIKEKQIKTLSRDRTIKELIDFGYHITFSTNTFNKDVNLKRIFGCYALTEMTEMGYDFYFGPGLSIHIF
jgi:hypothetical protein